MSVPQKSFLCTPVRKQNGKYRQQTINQCAGIGNMNRTGRALAQLLMQLRTCHGEKHSRWTDNKSNCNMPRGNLGAESRQHICAARLGNGTSCFMVIPIALKHDFREVKQLHGGNNKTSGEETNQGVARKQTKKGVRMSHGVEREYQASVAPRYLHLRVGNKHPTHNQGLAVRQKCFCQRPNHVIGLECRVHNTTTKTSDCRYVSVFKLGEQRFGSECR